jgi:hypothetical protein
VLTGRQIRNAAAVCNRGLVFQTDAWHCLGLQVAMLKKVHRQADPEFVAILHAIRTGAATTRQLDDLWQRCRCRAALRTRPAAWAGLFGAAHLAGLPTSHVFGLAAGGSSRVRMASCPLSSSGAGPGGGRRGAEGGGLSVCQSGLNSRFGSSCGLHHVLQDQDP